MPYCTEWLASNLKQCMPVRNVVQFDTAVTPGHYDMYHQNSVNSLQLLQSACTRSDDGTAILQLARFTNDNDDDIMTYFLLIILIPSVLFLVANLFFITIKTLERAAGRSFDPSLSGMGIDDFAAVLHFNILIHINACTKELTDNKCTVNHSHCTVCFMQIHVFVRYA